MGAAAVAATIGNDAVASGFAFESAKDLFTAAQRISPREFGSPFSTARRYDESARIVHALFWVVPQCPLLRLRKRSLASSPMRGECGWYRVQASKFNAYSRVTLPNHCST